MLCEIKHVASREKARHFIFWHDEQQLKNQINTQNRKLDERNPIESQTLNHTVTQTELTTS